MDTAYSQNKASVINAMKPQTISFFDMPSEIRDMIYDYCIIEELGRHSPTLYLHHNIRRPPITSLSRATEQEAMPMFLARKRFRLLVHYKSDPSIAPGNQWIARAIKNGAGFRSLRLYVFLEGDRTVVHVDFAEDHVSCEPMWDPVSEAGVLSVESMRLALQQSIEKNGMRMAGCKEIDESRVWAASIER